MMRSSSTAHFTCKSPLSNCLSKYLDETEESTFYSVITQSKVTLRHSAL